MRERPWSRLQERLESSDLGRTVISAFIVVLLVAILSQNLPPSKLRDELSSVARPVVRGLNIQQVWGVFAPDPRRTSLALRARIRYADGSVETWQPPHGLPFPDSYRDVRWVKLLEYFQFPGLRDTLWKGAAGWIARDHSAPGRRPVRVELLFRTQDLYPPGQTPDRGPWRQRVIYALDVSPSMLGEAAAP